MFCYVWLYFTVILENYKASCHKNCRLSLFIHVSLYWHDGVCHVYVKNIGFYIWLSIPAANKPYIRAQWYAYKVFWCATVLLVLVACKTPPDAGNLPQIRSKDTKSLFERHACGPAETRPVGRVDTTQRLQSLREQMIQANLSAYIITSGDDHQVYIYIYVCDLSEC